MDIYNAMMKAADYIEANPQVLNMHNVQIPEAEGRDGCALGWTGYFLGLTGGVYKEIHPLLGIDIYTGGEFFWRMGELNGGANSGKWFESATEVARTMRLYAAKYHAPAVPDWNAIASRQTIAEHEKSQELA